MGHNTKRLLIGAVLLGSALAVAGCSGIGRPDTFSDGRPVTTPITAVRVDVPAGGVRLRVEDGARVEGTTLVLSGCGQDCEVRYDVVVPRVDTGSITVRTA
jgi:hypothetical protein